VYHIQILLFRSRIHSSRAVATLFFAAFGGRKEGEMSGGTAPEPPDKGLAALCNPALTHLIPDEESRKEGLNSNLSLYKSTVEREATCAIIIAANKAINSNAQSIDSPEDSKALCLHFEGLFFL